MSALSGFQIDARVSMLMLRVSMAPLLVLAFPGHIFLLNLRMTKTNIEIRVQQIEFTLNTSLQRQFITERIGNLAFKVNSESRDIDAVDSRRRLVRWRKRFVVDLIQSNLIASKRGNALQIQITICSTALKIHEVGNVLEPDRQISRCLAIELPVRCSPKVCNRFTQHRDDLPLCPLRAGVRGRLAPPGLVRCRAVSCLPDTGP